MTGTPSSFSAAAVSSKSGYAARSTPSGSYDVATTRAPSPSARARQSEKEKLPSPSVRMLCAGEYSHTRSSVVGGVCTPRTRRHCSGRWLGTGSFSPRVHL